METSTMRIIERLPPTHSLLGIKLTTWARAIDQNQTRNASVCRPILYPIIEQDMTTTFPK